MQYSCDPVTAWRGLPAKRRFNLWAVLALAAVFALSYWIYSLEAVRDAADLAIHASIAADFDFGDLHSITSRLSYPVWHLLASSLYQLGMPLASAAGAVTALMKTLTCLFAYWLISAAIGAAHMMGTPRSRFSSISGENTTLTPLVYSTTTPV